MQPHVLIVDNAQHRLLFRPPWHWKPHLRDATAQTLHLPSGEQPPTLSAFTHVLLTGSEVSILEPQPWFEVEVQLIREAISKGLPILGSCFGHEMLVYALSGPQYLRPAETPEIGWTFVEMSGDDPLFEALPNPWRSFVFHLAEVHAPPEPWRVLGRSADCATHVLRYGDRPVWGIQAHPEISSFKARVFLLGTLMLGLRPREEMFRALLRRSPRHAVASTIARRFLAS
jgi:GMP synthase (glutamine-hydrolysing)